MKIKQITLTAEQATVLADAKELVALRRPDGSFVGWIFPNTNFIIPNECPFTPEEIAAAEKEADGEGPWHTTQEVLADLRRLEASHA
jgi:hypothetical protein